MLAAWKKLEGRRLSGTTSLAAFLLLATFSFFSLTPSVFAQTSPSGFNGTVKIHEDPETDPPLVNNEPQVCRFHIHGLNFDANSSGTWSVSSIAPTNNGVTRSGSWRADASGEWLMRPGIIPNGRYNLAVDQTGAPGGTKNATFNVSCPAGTGTGGVLGTGSTLPSTGQETGLVVTMLILSMLSFGVWVRTNFKTS